MRRTRGIIYLAGPMSGLTFDEADRWRVKAREELSQFWDCVSPLTGTDYIPDKGRADEKIPLIHTATGVAAKDEYYVRMCDWILANFLGSDRGSLGTAWELGFGCALGKQIISVIEPGSMHDHPIIRRRSDIFVPDLDEAIEYLKKIAV